MKRDTKIFLACLSLSLLVAFGIFIYIMSQTKVKLNPRFDVTVIEHSQSPEKDSKAYVQQI